MKRYRFSHRPTTFPSRFVGKHNKDGFLNSVPPTREQPCIGRRKIFVVSKTSRQAATDGLDKTIRRILIFDDHPDSLRLILGTPAHQRVHRIPQSRVNSRHFIIPGLLIVVAMLAMFWPLF
jgi:hypothetical protein